MAGSPVAAAACRAFSSAFDEKSAARLFRCDHAERGLAHRREGESLEQRLELAQLPGIARGDDQPL